MRRCRSAVLLLVALGTGCAFSAKPDPEALGDLQPTRKTFADCIEKYPCSTLAS